MPSLGLNPGDQLYKYQLTSPIGGGGFGEVWLAHDHSIDSDRAVKIIPESGVSINDRLREARIGNRLNHQNLVKVHYADVIPHNGASLVVIAMDYHPAGSIADNLNAGNFMPIPDVLHYITDLLRGLEYLHEQGLFHSDIKPQNILVGENGEGILTDYGISCDSPGLKPVHHRGFYKPHAAPEVLNSSQVNVQTDVYQTGLTMFRLLNGIGLITDKYNHLGEPGFYQVVKDGNVVKGGDYRRFIPPNLKLVVNRAINVNPSKRYPSAVAMRRALERLSYPGHWTCNSRGELEGHSVSCEFRFEEEAKGRGLHDFTAFKKSKDTGRETRVRKFCCKGAAKSETQAMRKNFLQGVVTGQL